MGREDAIKYGIEWLKDEYLDAKDRAFIKIALEALKQKPCEQIKWERDTAIAQLKELGYGFCEKLKPKDDVLDKIRAEIEQTRKMYLDMNDIDWLNGCDYVLSVIDKYKAEREDKE